MTKPLDDYLPTPVVAIEARLTERLVRKLADRGSIPCVRAGGRRYFARADLPRIRAVAAEMNLIAPAVATA